MPIRRLLENHVFGPDEITVLPAAFEDTLRTLRLVDRADPATEIIAKKIIELAQQGERDPVRLRERAIQFLSQEASRSAAVPGRGSFNLSAGAYVRPRKQ